MTKYFLVNNASRAAVYGIGTYIKQLTEYIRNGQSQYELCLLDIYSDVKEFVVDRDENGILHYKIPSFQRRKNVFSYYRCILFFLDSYIEKDEEVIFHFNYSQHYDLIRQIKSRYKSCHILYTIHYLNWCFTLNGNLTRFRKLIGNEDNDAIRENIQKDYLNDKRLFSLCDDIIVLSKFTYDVLCKDYHLDESKLHLVYNGMKDNPESVPYSNIDNSQKEILYVGRLDEIKGIEYVIKAFKSISSYMNAHLTIVGDGDFCRYLTLCEGIWDKVTFTGKIDKDKLEQFFSRATIGIQPSFHEQCSYSAIEMMAHGIPFVATDSTGLGEMMDYTPECLVHIDENDFQPDAFVKQLAERIERLLSDSQLRCQVSKEIKRLFHERYSLNCMGDALRGVWASAIDEENGYSKEFLPYLDDEMMRLINERPVLDMDTIGLTGIGCYLWWRICSLREQMEHQSNADSMRLQEYFIYYIDWLYDVLVEDGMEAFSSYFEPDPLNKLLSDLMDAGFYKTKVETIIQKIHELGVDLETKKSKETKLYEVSRTALEIYNLNL